MLTKHYAVGVWIDQIGDLGWFDTFTGGGVDSDEVKYHPGAMAQTISLGGTSEVDNVVVGRLYELRRDHPIVGQLLDKCGKVQMVIAKHPLDPDGNAWGRPLVYVGTYKRCTPPEHDSNATDAAIMELELTSAMVALG
jgi:hypothetical protein